MATNVTFNSVTYAVPSVGDSQWGDNVSNYLIAISTGCLQKSGGAFTLNAEVDFGGFFGLKSLYVKSKATNPSSAGIFRLGTTEAIGWRKNDNSGNLLLATNASDELEFDSVKLLRSGEIVNADISTLAAISLSKLAALTADRVLVSDVSGVISASSTTTTTLGYLDVSQSLTTLLSGKEPTITQLPISKGGTNSTTALNNNRVMQSSAGAIIEAAAITAARALISDANGIPTHSSVTDTELGYLSGVTSAIQTQLSGKEPTITTLSVSKGGTNSSTALNNNRIMQSSGGAIVEAAAITGNRALISDSNGIPTHSSVTNTELGYVSGVTSSIQTQLGNKAGLVSPAFTTPDIGAATGASLVVGTTPSLDASAALEVDSTTKGFLPPRMTQIQRDAIGTPATGLTIFNTDTNKVNVYNGASWGEVGSGQGGINYISDNDGSVLGAWATYADAAGTSPVDGTGGSPSVTFVTSSSSAMRGNSNFLFTHDANNRQGEGFSYLCSIDPSDRGKVIRFNFEYLIASGTYADGDLTVWFYDVTNGQVIQGAPTSILNSSLIERYQSEVQVPITCAQMRVIVHVTTTTATAYTMRFENFSFGPSEKLYSGIQTDWVAYTPTITGFGTPTNVQFFSRRNGQNLEINGRFTPSAVTATQVQVTLGFAGINANVTAGTLSTLNIVGVGATARIQPDYLQIFATSGQNYLTMAPANTVISGFSPANGTAFSTAAIGFFASVPILGWSSSSQVVSDDYTGREITAIYKDFSNTAFADGTWTTMLYKTVEKDSDGSYNSATGVYTAKSFGTYEIEAAARFATGGYIANAVFDLAVLLPDGTTRRTLDTRNYINSVGINQTIGTTKIVLNAGQQIQIQVKKANFGASSGLEGGAAANWVSISKVQGPSQILAGETISASYWLPGNFAASTTVPINFSSKEWDSQGTVTPGATNWKFTALSPALYRIEGSVNAIGTTVNLNIYKNGSIYKNIGSAPTSQNGSMSGTIALLAGEYIDIRPSASTTIAGGSLSANGVSNITITKVGNYV